MFFISEIWRRIWRYKGRSLISMSIAALLITFVGLYMGSIKKNEITLKSLSDTIPVTAQITNRNGSRDMGLEINTTTLDKLLTADIINPIYTAQAGGNLDPINRVEPVKICDTTIIATNSKLAVPFISDYNITFLDRWDETYLEEDEPNCIVSERYAARYDISIGDNVTFPMYIIKYDKNGLSYKFIEVGQPVLTVIGIIQNGYGSEETHQMIVSVDWLRLFVEDREVSFYYDSARCTIKDPVNLNKFKAYMEEINFGTVDTKADDRRNGDKLIIQDKIFIEAASKIKDNLNMLKMFQVPFFIIIVMLIILVSFLILRSYQNDMAIASSLGRPKILSGTSFFLENLFLYMLGCIIVLPIIIYITGIGIINMMSIYLLFMGCAFVGIWITLLLLIRFDTLSLLTKID